MEAGRKSNYSICEILKNGISLMYTRLFWKRARLIRLPVRVRGKKSMTYGTGFTTGYSCRIEMYGELEKEKLVIGENCIIGDYAHITANKKVIIGNNVLMASRVFITDTSHGQYAGKSKESRPEVPPNRRPLFFDEVIIGDNVWIGENVSILPGVLIGKGCVVGANSVVTKNLPDNTIAVGNPAKVIKKYNEELELWQKI